MHGGVACITARADVYAMMMGSLTKAWNSLSTVLPLQHYDVVSVDFCDHRACTSLGWRISPDTRCAVSVLYISVLSAGCRRVKRKRAMWRTHWWPGKSPDFIDEDNIQSGLKNVSSNIVSCPIPQHCYSRPNARIVFSRTKHLQSQPPQARYICRIIRRMYVPWYLLAPVPNLDISQFEKLLLCLRVLFFLFFFVLA